MERPAVARQAPKTQGEGKAWARSTDGDRSERRVATDFMHDQRATGKKLRVLTVSIPSHATCRCLAGVTVRDLCAAISAFGPMPTTSRWTSRGPECLNTHWLLAVAGSREKLETRRPVTSLRFCCIIPVAIPARHCYESRKTPTSGGPKFGFRANPETHPALGRPSQCAQRTAGVPDRSFTASRLVASLLAGRTVCSRSGIASTRKQCKQHIQHHIHRRAACRHDERVGGGAVGVEVDVLVGERGDD